MEPTFLTKVERKEWVNKYRQPVPLSVSFDICKYLYICGIILVRKITFLNGNLLQWEHQLKIFVFHLFVLETFTYYPFQYIADNCCISLTGFKLKYC